MQKLPGWVRCLVSVVAAFVPRCHRHHVYYYLFPVEAILYQLAVKVMVLWKDSAATTITLHQVVWLHSNNTASTARCSRQGLNSTRHGHVPRDRRACLIIKPSSKYCCYLQTYNIPCILSSKTDIHDNILLNSQCLMNPDNTSLNV